MRAIILAGGQGTRLRPYTTIIPKPLMPVGGSAIVEILIHQLVDQGVERITICLGERSRIIKLYLTDISPEVEIDYAEETEPLGTMGPLRLIHDLPDDFLVLNGDLLTDYRSSGSSAVIARRAACSPSAGSAARWRPSSEFWRRIRTGLSSASRRSPTSRTW